MRTLTALPTSFHRWPRLTPRTSTAGAVQSASKPCSRSAPRMPGVMNDPSNGSQIAGGDGMPIVEPPFRAGTASPAHPRPPGPLVQKKPQNRDRARTRSTVVLNSHPISRLWDLRISRRDQDHSLPPLGKHKSSCIYQRHANVKRRQVRRRQMHGCAPLQLQHEGHVLENQPTRTGLWIPQALEYLAHQRRLVTGDSGSPASRLRPGEGTPRRRRQPLERPEACDVPLHIDPRKTRSRTRVAAASPQRMRPMAGKLKAGPDAAEACEQDEDGERFALAWRHSRH